MECSLKNLAYFDFDVLFNELNVLFETIETLIAYIQTGHTGSEDDIYPALNGVLIILDRAKMLLCEESDDYKQFGKEFEKILSARSCQEVKTLIDEIDQNQKEKASQGLNQIVNSRQKNKQA